MRGLNGEDNYLPLKSKAPCHVSLHDEVLLHTLICSMPEGLRGIQDLLPLIQSHKSYKSASSVHRSATCSVSIIRSLYFSSFPPISCRMLHWLQDDPPVPEKLHGFRHYCPSAHLLLSYISPSRHYIFRLLHASVEIVSACSVPCTDPQKLDLKI